MSIVALYANILLKDFIRQYCMNLIYVRIEKFHNFSTFKKTSYKITCTANHVFT